MNHSARSTLTLTDANIAKAKIATAEEQYTPQDLLSLVWKVISYLHKANYMIDLLEKTAANFSIKHNLAGKPATPFRVRLKVEYHNNAANILGEQSFEIEVQELLRLPGPARECPIPDDLLNQMILASAPCSQQNLPNLPELVTYEVRLCTRNVGWS